MATMLQIIQQSAAEMNLPVPATVAGNSTQDVVQLLALLNALGSDLQQQWEWQALSTEYRFYSQYVSTTGTLVANSATVTGIPSTTGITADTWMVSGVGINQDTYVASVDSPTQVTLTQPATTGGTGVALTFGQTAYTMPADFDRLTNRTQWDKTKHWEMLGPETAQQWQWLKSGFISTGPRVRWRRLGGYFQIWPILSTNEYLGFEYISQYWARSSTGVPKQYMTVDTDTSIYVDRLMVSGLKKKYFEVKGFDTTAFTRDYEMQLSIAKAADQGAPNLSFAPRISTVLIGWEQIPDSGYGS